eukprot:CAMPEP_0184731636 /NCGR_PEP_ID=MMETSP0314-20130426/51500_1 /TAXON_ID=38298 /ORGANISM="Rhodella maculata, Strain CCMP 736" /LENGTH=38 /DNA_ID= /DNA_START= /DNA_END= /DNA_ORIENTATION=
MIESSTLFGSRGGSNVVGGGLITNELDEGVEVHFLQDV